MRILKSVSEAWIYSFKHKVFLLIFLLTLITPSLIHISANGLIIYLSKYVYHSDKIKIAHHSKYLGIASVLSIVTVPFVGKMFDLYSARFLYPLFLFLEGAALFGMYYYESFTSPLAFSLQISAELFASFVRVLQQSSLALHTPKHLKAGLFSLSSLLNRVGMVIYEQISGPVLDSTYARSMFLIGGIISMSLTFLFLMVALFAKAMFREEEQISEIVNGEYKELSENANYK